MPTLKGVECYISTPDRGRLPEYSEAEQDKKVEETHATCMEDCIRSRFIESQQDERFMINIYLLPDAELPEGTHFGVQLVFDGTVHSPPGRLIYYWGPGCTYKYSGLDAGHHSHASFLQDFKFSKLRVTEEASQTKPKVDISHLGEIEVRLFRYDADSRPENERNPYHGPKHGSKGGRLVNKVSEKDLKGRAINHVVGKGDVRLRNPSHHVPGKYLDVDEPWVTFRFLYRANAALKLLGLIPRTPSPVTAELAALPREELISRLADITKRNTTIPVKREPTRSTTVMPDPEQKPKRQRPSSPVLIDLTDD